MSRHAYWIATCLFLALIASKFSPLTGFTSLIRFGEAWENKRSASMVGLSIATVSKSNGYDGQFYAQLALDPLLQNSTTSAALDAPAYRARRILLPATAAAAGAGNPWWTLQIYALLNVVCWLALAWLIRGFVFDVGWTAFARWAGCMFSMGVLESVRQSLVDLPALLLLTLAIMAHERARATQTTGWLALAALAKESSFLGALALGADNPRWPFLTRRNAISLAFASIPLIAWSFYVSYRLPSSAGAGGTGNFTWPMLGIMQQVRTSLTGITDGDWDGRFTMGLLAVIGLATQAYVLWRTPNIKSAWWRVGAAYALLILFLSSWVWSGYWAACRALLPATIAFNLLLPGNTRAFWPLWIVGNSTILHAIWRFL
jgi:hypothetical protein